MFPVISTMSAFNLTHTHLHLYPPLFICICLYIIVMQICRLNFDTSYGRRRGKPAWQWSLPVPDPPNRWSTLRCLYSARPLWTHAQSDHKRSQPFLKTHSFLWHGTYCCKVGEETWGSSTSDPQSDLPGKALSRMDSGYLQRADT